MMLFMSGLLVFAGLMFLHSVEIITFQGVFRQHC